ncbi:hypothetical protein TKK_0003645 [Trichogramma kaykai]
MIQSFQIFRSPHNHTTSSEWQKFFNTCKDYKHIIIGGDFNAHHLSWGAKKNTPTGSALSETIIEYDLSIINDGSHTYFEPIIPDIDSQILTLDTQSIDNLEDTTSSPLDLTIVSTSLLGLTSWSTFPDKMHSDHIPVTTTIQLSFNKTPPLFTHKLNLKKTNWDL